MIKKIANYRNINVSPELIIVKTIEDARKYRHIGGPTVQVNGIDIESAARKLNNHSLEVGGCLVDFRPRWERCYGKF